MKTITATKEVNNEAYNSDYELLCRIQRGNKQAFTELVMLYQPQVFKLAYGFFADKDDAMEIVQETFLRIYQKIDQLKDPSTPFKLKNWIYRIAYNLCIDFYRKFKRKRVEIKEIYELQQNSENTAANPEDQIDLQNFELKLKKSVMFLSNRQRKIFVLKHYSGLKHQEISSLLQISIGTVKSQYHRAIKNLKKRLF
jgi:RNA polymerase sigma-70 factor (ECF subfamily)